MNFAVLLPIVANSVALTAQTHTLPIGLIETLFQEKTMAIKAFAVGSLAWNADDIGRAWVVGIASATAAKSIFVTLVTHKMASAGAAASI